MRVFVAAAALLAAAFVAAPSVAVTGPATAAPEMWGELSLTLAARGLNPGDRYAASFTATFESGRTYTLGASSQPVRRDGTIRIPVDMGDLDYYPGDRIEDVEMCLREPSWPYTVVSCTERDIGY